MIKIVGSFLGIHDNGWKEYLLTIESKLNTKFNIIINDGFLKFDNTHDYVEISRASYDNYLKRSATPLTDDYSSLTIVKSLFDIID